MCTAPHPQTSHPSLLWIWGWEFRAGQWRTENHCCFQISFQRVRSRETIRVALLTGVPAALQPGLFIEPKGSFNLRSITLTVNKCPPCTQQGATPLLHLCRGELNAKRPSFLALFSAHICKSFRDAAVSCKNNSNFLLSLPKRIYYYCIHASDPCQRPCCCCNWQFCGAERRIILAATACLLHLKFEWLCLIVTNLATHCRGSAARACKLL